jgi:hypothetical protein
VSSLPCAIHKIDGLRTEDKSTENHDEERDTVVCKPIPKCSEAMQLRLKVCDDGTLVQILCCWTLSSILFIFQNTTFLRLGSVSVFSLKPTQLGPVDRASSYLWTFLFLILSK